jgi:predicted MPP superfamily phosphohydrolase
MLEKGDEKIAVLGVENWGASLRFPKYGKLDKAYAGTEHIPVKLLLSHDPSHWDAEVRKKYPDIQATFSGHTHGMQMGVEIPSLGIKISPIRLRYRRWAGLYRENNQYLYVNRGFGFLGFPGRVGIFPEITLLEFTRGDLVG